MSTDEKINEQAAISKLDAVKKQWPPFKAFSPRNCYDMFSTIKLTRSMPTGRDMVP